MSRLNTQRAAAAASAILIITSLSTAVAPGMARADAIISPTTPCVGCATTPVPASDALNNITTVDDSASVAAARAADLPAPKGVQDNPDVPISSAAVSQVDLAVNSSASAYGNPYGCYGQTDIPHWSNAYASVHGRTRCQARLVELSVATTLYRGRWYGAQHLADGSSSRNYSNDSRDATPHWYCATGTTNRYTYEGDSNHEAFDGGRHFYGTSSGSDRFDC